MDIKEVPQDKTHLENFTREILYAKNEEKKYQSTLSSGWKTKTDALNEAWNDIEIEVQEAKKMMEKGIRSPIYFLMVKNLMTVSILSGYTGFWKITIKRHFKPKVFNNLPISKLKKYAFAFNISLEELIKYKKQ